MLAAISTMAVATGSMARPPSPAPSLDPAAFSAVVLPGSVAEPTPPLPSTDDGVPAPARIGDFTEQDRSFEPRANPKQPVQAESVVKATPRPTPPPRPTHVVRGTASWYCKPGVSVCHDDYPGGLYAAAGPSLRIGDWRGRTVSVCASGSCVNVTLIDSCWCASGKVIDLYSDAFSRLAPLGAGTVTVKVSW